MYSLISGLGTFRNGFTAIRIVPFFFKSRVQGTAGRDR